METALGDVSIYILDAVGVPVLAGMNFIEPIGLVADFVDNVAYQKKEPTSPPTPLKVADCRHRLLDLADPRLEGR